MTVIITFAALLYIIIQTRVVSFKFVQNDLYPLKSNLMAPLIHNNVYHQSLPYFCLINNVWYICMNGFGAWNLRTDLNTMPDNKQGQNLMPSLNKNKFDAQFLFRSFQGTTKDIVTFSERVPDDFIQHKLNDIPTTRRNNLILTNAIATDLLHTTSSAKMADFENNYSKPNVIWKFVSAVDRLEQMFYATTYKHLLIISPPERKINGISFALSSLFLQMALVALSTAVDQKTRIEIEKCTGFGVSEKDKIASLRAVLAWLPVSNEGFKFRYATRLVLRKGLEINKRFLTGGGSAVNMNINYLDGADTPESLSRKINNMVEYDSGGAMRDTFDDDELSEGICAVLLSTVYVRARWRSPPTLLNDTYVFRDHEEAPNRTTRMIRVNDIMRYVDIKEWDAEALEISYSTPGLSIFLVFPRGRSLRFLAERMSETSLNIISARMRTLRVAATLPLYTLRMTLLLPAKLQAMGIHSLFVETNGLKDSCKSLKLSHAVQRIMFWSEAGRHAFKDDGIEWDEAPQLNIMIDRPYLFYVRWHNVTILNGNFVL